MEATFTFDTIVRLQVTWTQDSVLIDPTTVTLRVEDPAADVTVVSTPTITNPSAGVYQYLLDASLAGTWEIRWEATGPKGASEGFFVMEKSRINILNP